MDQFALFWAAYPRRVAKKEARKAWAQVDGAAHLDAILSALAWQVAQPSWTKDDGAFVPHPATWLRGERWDDERPQIGANPHAVGGEYDRMLGLVKP